ncbi:hypothetical protein QF019_003057 [Pseudomonas frederiksbergensis]|uniref:hypothetical protein n=1 Tax=Pseudomonas frederiksbergensis TaxID=104087 RepID=UPI003D1D75CA
MTNPPREIKERSARHSTRYLIELKKVTRLTVWLICMAFGLSGCAGTTSNSLTETENQTDTGIRYFDTSPFLLIYADGKGGLESKVLYLPDSTKLRSIKPYAYGAKNDSTLKFDNGRLTSAKSTVDETAIPSAVISGLEKVATALIKAGNGGVDGIPAPYLFRILGDANGNWTLAGGQAMDASGNKFTIQFAN